MSENREMRHIEAVEMLDEYLVLYRRSLDDIKYQSERDNMKRKIEYLIADGLQLRDR